MTPDGTVVADAECLVPKQLQQLLTPTSERPVPYFNLVGPRRALVLQQDAEVKKHLPLRQPGTPEYAAALAAFRASPMTGCTSVLDQLRRKAGYNPAAPTQESLTKFFYIALMQHPLFKFISEPVDQMSFDVLVGNGPGKTDVAELVRKFQGSDEEAARRIRNQIDATMRAAVENMGVGQQSTLIQEHSLSAREQIQFDYVVSGVQIAVVMMPGMVILTKAAGQRFGLHWTFDSVNWPKHAEAVLQEQLKLVSDWIE
jgi:hypothetical protein